MRPLHPVKHIEDYYTDIYGLLVISAITDFILALIPIKIVWELPMVAREKIGVTVAISIGLLYVSDKPTLVLSWFRSHKHNAVLAS